MAKLDHINLFQFRSQKHNLFKLFCNVGGYAAWNNQIDDFLNKFCSADVANAKT